MTIDPLDGGVPPSATQLTGSNGCVTWTNLVDGHYTISEGTPNETNWVHSTPVSQSVDVDPSNPNPTVSFGNYCLRGSGGLSIGFWSNKNGQKLESPADLTFLCSLNLVNASGSHFCPGTTAALATWLLSANASNMAYMLSAQLAAMELNVRHGFTDGNAFDLCSGKTINALMAHANSLLVPPGNYTRAGNPLRSAEEADKNCLDALNNGASVIPATPCPRTFGS